MLTARGEEDLGFFRTGLAQFNWLTVFFFIFPLGWRKEKEREQEGEEQETRGKEGLASALASPHWLIFSTTF